MNFQGKKLKDASNAHTRIKIHTRKMALKRYLFFKCRGFDGQWPILFMLNFEEMRAFPDNKK